MNKVLERIGREELRGRAAVANAKLAYRSFQSSFSGPGWSELAARGASAKRPLWGSTSTKDPDYPDTLYVDELPALAAHTVELTGASGGLRVDLYSMQVRPIGLRRVPPPTNL